LRLFKGTWIRLLGADTRIFCVADAWNARASPAKVRRTLESDCSTITWDAQDHLLRGQIDASFVLQEILAHSSFSLVLCIKRAVGLLLLEHERALPSGLLRAIWSIRWK
jgi:hypothetical protein